MLCKFWKNCQFGDKCPWSHDPSLTKYKTSLCSWIWEMGHCRIGAQCSSSHDLRSKEAEICKFFKPKLKENGLCRFGDMCQYAHSIQELKPGGLATIEAAYKTTLCSWLWEKGTCNIGDRCSRGEYKAISMKMLPTCSFD